MTLQLRDEQQQVVDDVAAAFRAGHKRVMVSAACGFGKTELATAILQATHDNGKRGGFLCDRISLVLQTSERFDKYGLDHGILQADNPRFRPSKQIQVCSVATLQRRRWPEVNLIVVDEAHVLNDTVKKKLLAKDCFAIGLSATAVTPGLGKYFDTVVNAPPTNRLIERGLLVPLRIFGCHEPDMDGVKVNSLGEWDAAETDSKVLEVVGDVVAEYLKHGDGKKFIGFAASIAHAQELQRQFISAGINVATYTADDKPEDRSDIVQEFKKADSSIRGILSVEALTRGFDCADVEVLILARPLRKALAVHVQMLGRVMRTAPMKKEAIVLDHSGNCQRFWAGWNDLFENGVTKLDDGKKKEKPKPDEKKPAEPVKCPTCRCMHMPAPFCPQCGHAYPKKKAIEHVPGSLKELIAGKYTKQLNTSLLPQVFGYCLERREGAAAISQTKGLYKSITGEWPRVSPDGWGDVEPVPPSQEVRNRIKAAQIAFANRRQPGLPGTGAQA